MRASRRGRSRRRRDATPRRPGAAVSARPVQRAPSRSGVGGDARESRQRLGQGSVERLFVVDAVVGGAGDHGDEQRPRERRHQRRAALGRDDLVALGQDHRGRHVHAAQMVGGAERMPQQQAHRHPGQALARHRFDRIERRDEHDAVERPARSQKGDDGGPEAQTDGVDRPIRQAFFHPVVHEQRIRVQSALARSAAARAVTAIVEDDEVVAADARREKGREVVGVPRVAPETEHDPFALAPRRHEPSDERLALGRGELEPLCAPRRSVDRPFGRTARKDELVLEQIEGGDDGGVAGETGQDELDHVPFPERSARTRDPQRCGPDVPPLSLRRWFRRGRGEGPPHHGPRAGVSDPAPGIGDRGLDPRGGESARPLLCPGSRSSTGFHGDRRTSGQLRAHRHRVRRKTSRVRRARELSVARTAGAPSDDRVRTRRSPASSARGSPGSRSPRSRRPSFVHRSFLLLLPALLLPARPRPYRSGTADPSIDDAARPPSPSEGACDADRRTPDRSRLTRQWSTGSRPRSCFRSSSSRPGAGVRRTSAWHAKPGVRTPFQFCEAPTADEPPEGHPACSAQAHGRDARALGPASARWRTRCPHRARLLRDRPSPSPPGRGYGFSLAPTSPPFPTVPPRSRVRLKRLGSAEREVSSRPFPAGGAPVPAP